MRINIHELEYNEPKDVVIHGDEDWLDTIYSHFHSPKKLQTPRLSGRLTLVRQDLFVSVSGDYSYHPYSLCFRCNALFVQTLQECIELTLLTKAETNFAEKDLTQEELESLYVRNDEIDLEALINESVQLSLPMSPKCSKCSDVAFNTPVYSSVDLSEQEKSDHPFSALEGLRLPK